MAVEAVQAGDDEDALSGDGDLVFRRGAFLHFPGGVAPDGFPRCGVDAPQMSSIAARHDAVVAYDSRGSRADDARIGGIPPEPLPCHGVHGVDVRAGVDGEDSCAVRGDVVPNSIFCGIEPQNLSIVGVKGVDPPLFGIFIVGHGHDQRVVDELEIRHGDGGGELGRPKDFRRVGLRCNRGCVRESLSGFCGGGEGDFRVAL